MTTQMAKTASKNENKSNDEGMFIEKLQNSERTSIEGFCGDSILSLCQKLYQKLCGTTKSSPSNANVFYHDSLQRKIHELSGKTYEEFVKILATTVMLVEQSGYKKHVS